MDNIDYVKEILKEKGYKYTNQRAQIYNIFLENPDKHLSSEDVFSILNRVHPEIGIATVYRTLMLFEEIGILYKISFDDGVARYEIKSKDGHHRHHHLICINCKNVTEVKIDLLDTLENNIEREEDFKIVDHNLKFYGYCKNCKEKKEKLNEE